MFARADAGIVLKSQVGGSYIRKGLVLGHTPARGFRLLGYRVQFIVEGIDVQAGQAIPLPLSPLHATGRIHPHGEPASLSLSLSLESVPTRPTTTAALSPRLHPARPRRTLSS